jgi:Uma2 family endonuclease
MIQKRDATGGGVHTVVGDVDHVSIPVWVCDLESFRHWADAETFPESGRVCYFPGEVWVDMSREQVFSHNQVKAEITYVLHGLTDRGENGRFFPDGLRLTSVAADLSCVPDGTLVSAATLDSDKVRLVEGSEEGFVELEGTPDLVIEIVSPSSEQKDTKRLKELYWQAGIPEYWIVDVRGDRLDFQVLRYGARGYVAVRRQAGWLPSKILGKKFRLTRQTDPRGNPRFRLEVG